MVGVLVLVSVGVFVRVALIVGVTVGGMTALTPKHAGASVLYGALFPFTALSTVNA